MKQPRAVWAVAFACVISFMGLGLVDPILTSIAQDLHATAGQVSLLFTSYMAVTGVAMLITGFVSSRIGAKKTLLAGLVLIVVFSAVAGAMDSIGGIVAARAFWGLGNALFIATSLATIVTLAAGSLKQAVLLYESALGIGIGLGPIVGGQLGGISWRAPFFGVAVLMCIALVATMVFLPSIPPQGPKTSVADPIKALKYPGLLVVALTSLLYNFGFFTLMLAAPFPLQTSASNVGWIFFGWGLLLAFFSIWGAPWIESRIGTVATIVVALVGFAALLAIMAIWTDHKPVIVVCVILAGAFLGINNTVITTLVMGSAPVPRPVASAAYSFVRFAGASVGPYLAGKLLEHNIHAPFWMGAGATFLAVVLLLSFKRFVPTTTDTPSHGSAEEAEDVLVGDAD
ncbi:MFS transporter [Nocardioides sp. CER19]|uniref:MFS transporter n=1 Tax=Nocardioides sp. CER19 TaxID=3038538 RepID=UPI002448FDF0|nr:MFS transporter [Nocardioides sp. CER19]MDH2413996.1 MFS transporter [Nocardioides sp. CER19]